MWAWVLVQFDPSIRGAFVPAELGGFEACADRIVSTLHRARGAHRRLLDPAALVVEIRTPTLVGAVPSEYAITMLPTFALLMNDESALGVAVRDVEAEIVAARARSEESGGPFVRMCSEYLSRLERLRGGEPLPADVERTIARLDRAVAKAPHV